MRTVDVHINWKCRFEKEILTYKTSSFPVVYINVFILVKFISVSEINGTDAYGINCLVHTQNFLGKEHLTLRYDT